MKIVVIGAGAWGTALAVSACGATTGSPTGDQRHAVTLWARSAAQVAAMQATRENQRYLPGIELPLNLALSAAPQEALPSLASGADLVVIATPMAALRGHLTALRGVKVPVAWLCKGFEAEIAQGSKAFGLLSHEIDRKSVV